MKLKKWICPKCKCVITYYSIKAYKEDIKRGKCAFCYNKK